MRYAYTLHESAAAALVGVDQSEQSELLRFFDALARNPGQRAEEAVTDELGRRNEVAYTDHFRVVYWPDHAVKEVRIMDVRRY